MAAPTSTHPRVLRASRLRGLAAALLAAIATLLVPAPASALEKGLNTDMTWGISSEDQDLTSAAMTDLGASWHRMVLPWYYVEKARKGSYSGMYLNMYDQAIAKADAQGAKVVVTVYTAPNWASGTSNLESPPLNPADYADFMSFVANRYRGKVDAWEIWNEQNTARFWSTGPDAAQYARLLKAAYPAVKAADPNATVLYGGTYLNDWEFLEGAYAEIPNLGDYFDALGTHPYNGVTPPDQVALGTDGRIPEWSFASYRELHDVMVDNGDDKPIWFTEFGWSTFAGEWGVSQAVQAAYLTQAFRCAEQDPYVEVGLWYMLRNNPYGGDGQDSESQFGLTNMSFVPKQSYNAFKSYTSGSGGCTYQYPSSPPVPDPTPDPAPDPTPDRTPDPTPDPLAEPTPEPTPEPEPTSEPTVADEPEGEVESSSVTGSGRPVFRVRIRREWRASASRTASGRKVRVAFVGRVKRADRGHVVLKLQRRGRHGKWGHGLRLRARVGENGRFRERSRLTQGRWRVRAVYRVGSSSKTRSRLVYFRG
jgi:hypothetical protein